MSSSRKSFALACAVAAAFSTPASAIPQAQDASRRSTYLVEFEEPALAMFAGAPADPRLAGLKATRASATATPRLELESAASLAYRGKLSELRDERLAQASARLGRRLEPRFVYEVLGNGMAVELTAEEASALQRVDGIKRVEPEFRRRLMTDTGPRFIHADAVWNGVGGVSTRGEGVVIGVIDTGINALHPSFAATGPVDGYVHANPRGRFFGRCAAPATAAECNAKLIGLYDFTTSGTENQEMDNAIDVHGHGTHVAGTAAGNVFDVTLTPYGGAPQQLTLSGVAPHANLISYKACEGRIDGSLCDGSWLLAALEQAALDEVDVINYSVGGEASNPWTSQEASAMLAAREAGIVVMAAAGNDGPAPGSIGSPADAPWVVAVGDSTHDRTIANFLVDLTGGASAPPLDGVIDGVGPTGGVGPRALIRDPQFPACMKPEGGNPWPANRFAGEIVVCERNGDRRLEATENVRSAGGGGVLLLNTEAQGDQIAADAYAIPTILIRHAQAQALRTWLDSGTGHSGRITGNRFEHVPRLANVVADHSGRGPAVTPGILKPDLAAPGVDVIAPIQRNFNGASGVGSKSGTSMATPHLSGAAALLLAAHPAWTPSQVDSALLTTASAVLRTGAAPVATPLDAGAGLADVAKAIKAGLSFHASTDEFLAADPAKGGVPRTLNRPSLLHEACFERCSLARTVTDLAGGASWRVEIDAPAHATVKVTPSQFTLAAGASQRLDFEFDVSDARLVGAWAHGRVRFVRTGGAPASDASIPLSLYADPGAVPGIVELTTAGESGQADLALSSLVALPAAAYRTSMLAAPQRTQRSLPQDPTPDEPYDIDGDDDGGFFTLVEVPAATAQGRMQLRADTSSATAADVDLFVGEDRNADGRPDADEVVCSSTSPTAAEHCVHEIALQASPRRYWVLAHNFDAGGDAADARDTVVLETLLIDPEPRNAEAQSPASLAAGKLTLTGPGHTDSGEAFDVRVAWNDPTLLPGERRVGYLYLTASAAAPDRIGPIPFVLTRAAQGEDAAALLAPGVTRRMRLEPHGAQQRLYFDVPPNASELKLHSTGNGEVDLYLTHVDDPGSPRIASAPPREQATASSIHAGAEESIRITGSALKPGRWYAMPVNAGEQIAEFQLTVDLEYAGARKTPSFGAWYDPARSGSGLVLFPAAPLTWGLAWYTYAQDGAPTWYLGTGTTPAPADGVWRVSLQRFRWDGAQAVATIVGEAQLAFIDESHFTFGWTLDGESGSQPMSWLGGGRCPQLAGQQAAITGIWYSPQKPGFGYSIDARENLQSYAAYFYDGQGVPRWALAQASSFEAESMPVTQRTGACPLCDLVAPQVHEIGVLARRYDSESTGQISFDVELAAPLQGSWTVDLPAKRISEALTCP